MTDDFLETIQNWRREERRFCVATVVRTADVTSAKAGAKALVSEGGEIVGHLGGACVKTAILKAARNAFSTSQTELIRVKPNSLDQDAADLGIQLYKSGCPSGGTVDILIEPYQPQPRLIVIGNTPIAKQITAQSRPLGLRISAHQSDENWGEIEDRDFIVIASQGQGDVNAIKKALSTKANQISFVASHKKAALVLALSPHHQAAQARERLKAPAGLDIGAIDPAEIALSILAEITLWRRRGVMKGEPLAALA